MVRIIERAIIRSRVGLLAVRRHKLLDVLAYVPGLLGRLVEEALLVNELKLPSRLAAVRLVDDENSRTQLTRVIESRRARAEDVDSLARERVDLITPAAGTSHSEVTASEP
jgi:hypothetical protein